MKYMKTLLIMVLIFIIGGCTEETSSEDTDGDGVIDLADCALLDNSKWENIEYNSTDLDSDGVKVDAAGVLCTNGALPNGYFKAALGGADPDCNDSNASVWRNVDSFYDVDNDGVGSGTSYSACVGNEANLGSSFLGNDCNDQDVSIWINTSYNSTDLDLDGVEVEAIGELCTNGALPSGYFEELLGDADPDCDDSDASVWTNIVAFYDGDSDGIGSGNSYLSCVGDSLESNSSLTGYDCDDVNELVWRSSVIYQDIDGDGVGSGPGNIACIGASPPLGYSMLGFDPVDSLTISNSSDITDFNLPSSIITVMESDADPDEI